ncbi:MAG: Gfo/Idh/MocA family oxidoreductase [Planctomycetes bacterium]|nr:Gfo/Idh/MocA family oxidoreductase [Planctomycetota bacterium]
MSSLSRRQFCGSVAVGLAGAAVGTAQTAGSFGRILGSNGALRVGVVGVRGRGRDHIGGLRRLADVRLTALCDVDRDVLGSRLEKAKADGDDVEGFTDVRKLLDSGRCDAISVATPNHTHALIGVWAAQRGIHSYVEKPIAHDVWSGRQLVAAAKQHGVVVQTGSQCRSMTANQEVMAFLRSGELGRIVLARGLCYKPRGSIGKVAAPLDPPPQVDYDLWLGPAPFEKVRRRQFHYDWHWQWHYGNGDLGNQGVHQMDLARWAVGATAMPKQVLGVGGRFGYVDDGETPNTQVVFCDYDEAPIVFEVRGLPRAHGDKQMDRFLGTGIGVVIHCEHGYVVLTSYDKGHACDLDGKVIRKFEGGGDHYQNWVDAVRAGDASKLSAGVEIGHLSAALCDLGNASYREGALHERESVADRLRALPDLNEAFLRLENHLRSNEVALSGEWLRVGALLQPKPDGSDRPRPAQRDEFAMPELV